MTHQNGATNHPAQGEQRHENTTPCEIDADVTPEERHANKNRENNEQTESHMQEQLNIDA